MTGKTSAAGASGEDTSGGAPGTGAARRARSADGERLIAVFSRLIEPIGASLPDYSEVVLHDLSLLPNSIVAIHGDVTGRSVGDPATDLLLRRMAEAGGDDHLGYETTLPDGRRIRSSTTIIRDVLGDPVAALCINSDLSVWSSLRDMAEGMLAMAGAAPGGTGSTEAAPRDPSGAPARSGEVPEVFAHNVDELAAHLIHSAVAASGVPVDLMQKRHKLAVVRDLKARGMFLLRDAVDMIAGSLGVTRFTIYNYLNEIADEGER